MRATLTIDDDLLTEAQRLAAERAVSIDIVVSDLLRQSLKRPVTVKLVDGLPVFDVPPGTASITIEDVRRAEEDV